MSLKQKIILASKTININTNNFHKESNIKEIAIIGHPGRAGGATTELDHQIICWQKMGIEVHICHVAKLDANCLKMNMKERGCIYHDTKDWKSLEGMHVIAFCNKEFLNSIEDIKKYAKTATWVNCMTWNFHKEIAAHKKGLIDLFLYQTDHQFSEVSKKLINANPKYRPYPFRPYFFSKDFKYKDNRKNDCFQFGRISRSDADKFHRDQLWIYDHIDTPLPKKGLILGWGDKPSKKFDGNLPAYLQTVPVGHMAQRDFYDFADVIIMSTDTLENLPRVGFEAMASGSVLIVDNRGGWKLQVEDGKTGCLCDGTKDFIWKTSELAHNEQKKEDMRAAAKKKLDDEWGIEASMKSWDNVFKRIEKIQ